MLPTQGLRPRMIVPKPMNQPNRCRNCLQTTRRNYLQTTRRNYLIPTSLGLSSVYSSRQSAHACNRGTRKLTRDLQEQEGNESKYPRRVAKMSHRCVAWTIRGSTMKGVRHAAIPPFSHSRTYFLRQTETPNFLIAFVCWWQEVVVTCAGQKHHLSIYRAPFLM